MSKFYSNEEFQKDLLELVAQIRDSGIEFKNIYGVPQGGTVLATALGYHLNLPHAFTLSPDTLVVDDIVHSGKTRETFHNYK